jgi:hypothetical protein
LIIEGGCACLGVVPVACCSMLLGKMLLICQTVKSYRGTASSWGRWGRCVHGGCGVFAGWVVRPRTSIGVFVFGGDERGNLLGWGLLPLLEA